MKPRYDLTGQILGTGRFGRVELARHPDLPGRELALKLLKLSYVHDRDSLLEEARRLVRLPEHDHVVRILDAGSWDSDCVFIASEVCSCSVDKLKDGAALDPSLACKIVSETCRGLDHVHRAGLLHLDIRPANILIGVDGHAKLADFGLARWVGDPTIGSVYSPHAAPELDARRQGTVAADQFALAMTLAHLLTAGAVCARSPADPVNLDLLRLNVPDRLKRVIRKATQTDPAKRYEDIEAFKQAVDRATPARSIRALSATSFACVAGEITIDIVGTSPVSVVYKRRNRRVSSECADSLNPTAAEAHVRRLVADLAYP